MTFPLEWYLLFLVSIPQTLLVTLVGLSVFNIQLPWRKIVAIAFVSGVLAYSVRFIPMVFGFHAFISLIIVTFSATFIGRIKFLYALCAMTVGIAVLAVIESCLLPLFFYHTNIYVETIKANPWHNVMVFLPEAIAMLCLYLLIKKVDFRMWDLNNVG